MSELADLLDVTGNAVRAHLSKLERDNLARPVGKRAGVRKPETVYGLTDEGEQLFPKAYDELLNRLLDALSDRLPPDDIRAVLQDVARQIASDYPSSNGTLRNRVQHAQHVLESLGGLSELDVQDNRFVIRGCSCPFGAVADHHTEICHLAEQLLRELTDRPVKQRCQTEGTDRPKCVFEISTDPALH